jgi:hypothetical protein
MKKVTILSIIGVLLFSACKNNPAAMSNEVRYFGALHDIMQGNVGATITLKELEQLPNLYALGAFENLKGEVQIFNSEVVNSRKTPEMVKIDNTFSGSATLLVYAQVEEWQTISVPKMVRSKGQFEIFVYQEAEKAGIDVSKPFPFLLEGNISKLNWHIVDWNPNSTANTPQGHMESGLNGVLANGSVEILGFYSKEHQGVFTHKGSKTHMHFRTNSAKLAGHVDNFFMGYNMNLKLPK